MRFIHLRRYLGHRVFGDSGAYWFTTCVVIYSPGSIYRRIRNERQEATRRCERIIPTVPVFRWRRRR